MPIALAVLLVEDSAVDAALIERHLRRGGFDPTVGCVETGPEMAKALQERAWDVIVCDHNMPGFNVPKALAVVHGMDLDIPFIIVSGSIDVDLAIAAMKAGAHDFLEKDNLARLNPAIEREVQEAGERRKRREAEKALAESEQQLRELSGQLFVAQEQERRKLAREIHDSIGQSLTAIKIRTQNVMHRIEHNNPRTPETSLETILPVIQQTIDDVRRMQTDLHPAILDDVGIKPAIRSLVKGFNTTYPGIKITTKLPVKESDVPPALRSAVFRVTQEAINNAAKHSGGNEICVCLSGLKDTFILEVADNGRGFDVAESQNQSLLLGKLGLVSMRERVQGSGGKFSIGTTDTGTRVRAVWPIA